MAIINSKEQARRNQVLRAMETTPMARKIAIETNQDAKGENQKWVNTLH